MSPKRSLVRRGVTLIELLVAVVISSIMMVAVIGVTLAYQRSLNHTEAQRASGEGGKDALYQLERTLHLAGFGVDPRWAFDLSWFRCASSGLPTGIENQPVCRDSTSGPDSLVFMARNPYYRVDAVGTNGCTQPVGCPTGMAWPIQSTSSSASPPTITVTAQAGQVFYAGQVLELVCTGGSVYTMATVSQLNKVTANGNVTLRLYPTDATVPYFENAFSSSCYSGAAIAFAVDRYDYFVQTYNGVPWLMLDTGLDLNTDGQDPWTTQDPGDLLPIAPYVEDLQVAYVLDTASAGTAPDSDKNWTTGDDATTTSPEAPTPTATAPTFNTPATDPSRANLHPANIRAVRVSLALRSSNPDLSFPPSWAGDPLPAMENEQRVLTAAQLGQYRRQKVGTTLAVRNLQAAGLFDF